MTTTYKSAKLPYASIKDASGGTEIENQLGCFAHDAYFICPDLINLSASFSNVFATPPFESENHLHTSKTEAPETPIILSRILVSEFSCQPLQNQDQEGAMNERLKSMFKYIDNVLQNTSLPGHADLLKIIAAILNRYHPRFISDRDNHLGNYIFDPENNLNAKRRDFVEASDEDLSEFPRLSLDELYRITLGTYQIPNIYSYINASIIDNEIPISVFRQPLKIPNLTTIDPILFRAKFISAHKSTGKYLTYILIDKCAHLLNKIIAYYCQCNSGMRTVGCCSHVACLIWYLSTGRHSSIRPPAANHSSSNAPT
uniref:SWIM-type domain-containing protein n=1 Tax=Tetranychus urticae TaxID=32264 RepID=T1KPK5_TETUR